MSADYKRLIRNYFHVFEAEYPSFRKAAKFGTGFIILGVFLLYMQYIQVFKNIQILSVVFILVGVFSFWKWMRPYFFLKRIFYTRPADGDMDVWFHNDVHEVIKPRAFELLRINPSSLKDENVIIVPYPVFWDVPGMAKIEKTRRQGEDGKYIYTVWAVQILIVTDYFLSYYSCHYDWLGDKMFNERTNEYFFDDIVSVSNDDEPLDYTLLLKDAKKAGQSKIFKLRNMSGDELKIITDVPSLEAPSAYVNSLDRLVQALRILLRHRRKGVEIEVNKPKPDEQAHVEEPTVNTAPVQEDDTVMFHRELRQLYEEYSKEMDELRKEKNKAYRGV